MSSAVDLKALRAWIATTLEQVVATKKNADAQMDSDPITAMMFYAIASTQVRDVADALKAFSQQALLRDQDLNWCLNRKCTCDDSMNELLQLYAQARSRAQKTIALLSSSSNTGAGGGGGGGGNDTATSDHPCQKFPPLSFTKGSLNCKYWFANVVGLDEPKKQIENGFLNPLKFPKLYGKLSKGILLYGLPGTGKTFLVKATVNELQQSDNARVQLHAPTAADLKDKYFGGSEKLIKAVFKCASENACKVSEQSGYRQQAVSVIFLDEIESLAGSRDTGDEFTATTVNALLQAMDGIDSAPNVAVIAATNYPWKLDSAILRRFSTQIYVPLPNAIDILNLLNQSISQFFLSLVQPARDFAQFCRTSLLSSKAAGAGAGAGTSLAVQTPTTTTTESLCDPPRREELNPQIWKTDERFQPYVRELDDAELQAFAALLEKQMYSNSDVVRIVDAAVRKIGDEAVQANAFVMVQPNARDKVPLFVQSAAAGAIEEEEPIGEEVAALAAQFTGLGLGEERKESEATTSFLTRFAQQKWNPQLNFVSTLSFQRNSLLDKWNSYRGSMNKLLREGEVPPDDMFVFLRKPQLLSVEIDRVRYINTQFFAVLNLDDPLLDAVYLPENWTWDAVTPAGGGARGGGVSTAAPSGPVKVLFQFKLKVEQSMSTESPTQGGPGGLQYLSFLNTEQMTFFQPEWQRLSAANQAALRAYKQPGLFRQELYWMLITLPTPPVTSTGAGTGGGGLLSPLSLVNNLLRFVTAGRTPSSQVQWNHTFRFATLLNALQQQASGGAGANVQLFTTWGVSGEHKALVRNVPVSALKLENLSRKTVSESKESIFRPESRYVYAHLGLGTSSALARSGNPIGAQFIVENEQDFRVERFQIGPLMEYFLRASIPLQDLPPWYSKIKGTDAFEELSWDSDLATGNWGNTPDVLEGVTKISRWRALLVKSFGLEVAKQIVNYNLSVDHLQAAQSSVPSSIRKEDQEDLKKFSENPSEFTKARNSAPPTTAAAANTTAASTAATAAASTAASSQVARPTR